MHATSRRLLASAAAMVAACAALLFATAAASAQGDVSTQDKSYLQQAHQTNLAEIAAGMLAEQKAQDAQVKQAGSTFVTDHTQLDQKLRQLAGQLGVTLPSSPTPQQQALAQKYMQATGKDFDTLYVTTQMAGHQQSLQAGQTEQAQGTSPQVKALAAAAAPVIQGHGMLLDKAAQSIGIPNRMPSMSPSGTASPTPGTGSPTPMIPTTSPTAAPIPQPGTS